MRTDVRLREKSRFSSTHIRCACLCAKKCDEIEREYKAESTWEENAELYMNDISYASGSIISSVSYLESTINEFYSDCLDKAEDYHRFDYLNGIKLDTLKSLAAKWNYKKYDRVGLLDKSNTAAKIITGIDLDKTENKYVEVGHLLSLRHSLVHYKAKWQDPDSNENSYALDDLNGKFSFNPFKENTGNSFFPHKCLGKGCALWGIKTSIDFVADFYEKIGVKLLIDADSIYSSMFK